MQLRFLTFDVRVIGRTDKANPTRKKSVVAQAAYNLGTSLTLISEDSRKKKKEFNFSRKAEQVSDSGILAPDFCQDLFRNLQELLNAIEAVEKRRDSQLGRSVTMALPIDLPHAKRVELVREFCKKNFVDKGMIAHFAIHDLKHNPHVHILLTTRHIVNGKYFGKKAREWNNKKLVSEWRSNYAKICNEYLEKNGSEVKVSTSSFDTLGISSIPTLHIGKNPYKKETQLAINNNIKLLNKAILSKEKKNSYIKSDNKFLFEQRFFKKINDKNHNIDEKIISYISNIQDIIKNNELENNKRVKQLLTKLEGVSQRIEKEINLPSNITPAVA